MIRIPCQRLQTLYEQTNSLASREEIYLRLAPICYMEA